MVGILFSAFQVGQPLNDALSDVRLLARHRAASGDIALVAVDNRSLDDLGAMPWPRHMFARVVHQLNAAGARRIFIQQPLSDRSTATEDATLEQALKPLGKRVILPVTLWVDPATGKRTDTYPLARFRESASLAHTNFEFLFGTVRRLPYDIKFGATSYPSLAAKLANTPPRTGHFAVDYAIDPTSIPTVSASDIVRGKGREIVAGRDVVIGLTYTPFSDGIVVPRYGQLAGIYRHIIGAETLKIGTPVDLVGTPADFLWPIALAPALLIVGLSTWANRRLVTLISVSGGIAVALLLPFLLDRYLISIDVTGPIFLLAFYGVASSWSELRQMYRNRGITNSVSGLPNLAALHQRSVGESLLIGARVHNFAAIVATLSIDEERALVEQVANRLMVGTAHPHLYQGDEGIFAWFAEQSTSAAESHLEALHTLFRSPVVVGERQFDLVLTFGFDADPERPVANRLASALVAADEAFEEGRKWKEHDSTQLEDSSWKLSMLSQLDSAIDAGDLWVAYQPKLDLRSGIIVGAEALARWTHVDKGPISPMEFILAAEQSNRIEKLTHYVLEHAIRVAAAINSQGVDFHISVNLSARLIDDPNLVRTVRSLLAKHSLPPERLTLEVTETAALGNAAKNLVTLRQLRQMGVLLSVDDYGTGMSTLDYLQRIPATEIKIDRSFVAVMRENQATKVMVNSTIQLAHALGQTVVAEGVEDEETLEELRAMNCDVAQGYLIGRPMAFRELGRRMILASREGVG